MKMTEKVIPETIQSLMEMREVCAACFRVIAKRPETGNELEAELKRIGMKAGFGVRCQDIIARAMEEL